MLGSLMVSLLNILAMPMGLKTEGGLEKNPRDGVEAQVVSDLQMARYIFNQTPIKLHDYASANAGWYERFGLYQHFVRRLPLVPRPDGSRLTQPREDSMAMAQLLNSKLSFQVIFIKSVTRLHNEYKVFKVFIAGIPEVCI